MRRHLHIKLQDQSVRAENKQGEDLVRAGRYLIAKTLLEQGIAQVNPLSPDNQLIFSAGPFAGTNFSNANRISVGCKSPLTGGIKEANAGGTFSLALGHLGICGLTLYGTADQWNVIHIARDGSI
ncbi:MAG: Tungsten-containing aldehyde ferredoxin oxidoreductase, partial [Gammaproteobacteria bacterium]|nr:Tungsten-containing aldehyde ferredoxin oxidoreductase [Gammaproteobacteria bacterium]